MGLPATVVHFWNHTENLNVFLAVTSWNFIVTKTSTQAREKEQKAKVTLQIFNIIAAKSALTALQWILWSISGAKVIYPAGVSVLTRLNTDPPSTPDENLAAMSPFCCHVISFSFEIHIGLSMSWQQTSLTSALQIVPLLLSFQHGAIRPTAVIAVFVSSESIYFQPGPRLQMEGGGI